MINLLLVFVGGGLGSCLRYGISVFIPVKEGSFPLATLMTNLISCLLIGFLIGSLFKMRITEQQRFLLIIGFCGGFSTFSTFGVEIFQMIKSGNITMALSYIFISILFGVALVFVGLYFGSGLK